MNDNNKKQLNNFNQDSNQLSDDELNAVNGGGILDSAKDFVEDTIDKAKDLYDNAKESIETIEKYY